MKYVLSAFCIAALAISAGCGSPEPSSVVENVDKDALADYDRMIEESTNAMTAEDAADK